MKKILLYSVFLMLSSNFHAQEIKFKDENLKKSLIFQIDNNKNGQLILTK